MVLLLAHLICETINRVYLIYLKFRFNLTNTFTNKKFKHEPKLMKTRLNILFANKERGENLGATADRRKVNTHENLLQKIKSF